MQRAGERVALSIISDFEEIGGISSDARILLLCGKGHNAGDALLAACVILNRFPNAKADIVFCMGEASLRPLAKRSLKKLREAANQRFCEVALADLKNEFPTYELCLEGVFGFQFRPPMDPATAELMALVNSTSRIRFRAAVDLPGGIAESEASTVFRADFTYATGIVKSPAVAEANQSHVGRLRWLDLDFFTEQNPWTNDRILARQLLAPLGGMRPAGSDKRTFGHLCVVGGSHNYPGAVVLAVRAALRSGVGLVTAFVPEQLAPHYASEHPEVMWVGCPLNEKGGLALSSLEELKDSLKRADAMLIGPGLGAAPDTLELVRQLAAEAKLPVVLDADALQPEVIRELLHKPFVCTPHAGELKRISPALYQQDQFAATKGVLVAKGQLTHITDGRTRYYSLFGGPVLARGGSGDMLAGLIGGLLAQMPESPILAACRGVVWHGLAADLLARTHGQVAVENSQLLEQLGPALKSTHGRLIDGAAGVHGSERPA